MSGPGESRFDRGFGPNGGFVVQLPGSWRVMPYRRHMPLFGRAKTNRAATPASSNPAPPEPAQPEEELCGADDYRDELLSQVSSLRPFGIGLLEACGLTLCESISSDIDLPVFTSATVDGWAVRASNLVGSQASHPIVLPLVGQVEADGQPGAPLSPGTTIRVKAGAPVPDGADAVVPLSEGQIVQDGGVCFMREAAFHQNLWLAGSRVADGDPLLPSGAILDPRMIAMLAEVGLDKVLARPKPRVIIGTVGAELIDAGLPITRLTQKYDAVTPMITAAASHTGAQTFPIGVLPEEPSALGRALSDQLVRADLFLVAAQPTRQLADVLAGLGTVEAAMVAMTPAGPSLFAFIGSEKVPMLVLPPDIVGAYVTYEVFGRPLVRALAGADPIARMTAQARISESLPVDEKRTQYVLGVLVGQGVSPLPVGPRFGGVELARANVIVDVRPGARVMAGDDVTCWLLDE